MANYKIEITETLSRIIEIKASSSEEYIDKAREMYKNEDIVLDGDDCVATDIEELEE